MARRIKSTEEAAGVPAQDAPPIGGICFANNNPNQILRTGKGVPFKFQGTRQYFTDPDEIAVLKVLAKDPYSRIFLIDEEVADEPTAVQIIEPESLPAVEAPAESPVVNTTEN